VRRALSVLGLSAALVAAGTPAAAQRVTLTVTGGPVAFPAPTGTDFANGFIDATAPLAYTLNASRGALLPRTSTLSIRSTSATLGSGKPLADLQWRRADVATWTPMTTVNAMVDTRQGRVTYSNTILFRMLLTWTGTPPATYMANLVLTESVTSP
jgi:hypothetical protein